MEHLNLERKYGVVRYLATHGGDREQEVVFQSDDPMETMHQLEARAEIESSKRNYKLIVKEANTYTSSE